MNATAGHAAVAFAWLAALGGMGAIGTGLLAGEDARLRSAALRWSRLAAPLVLAGALAATGAMQHALLTHDFSLQYVADNASRETPLLYTVTGMWSALQGSILLWALVLSGYLFALVWRFKDRAEDSLVAWAALVVYAVAAFFFALMLGPANPFAVVHGAVPADGAGPNPLLQDYPLVAFHPPLLYLGFVGFTVPFAFGVASLVTGRLGEGWLVETRRWALFAWACLTVGILLGAWWSYQVLGWGGFWAWDPVENAALLPWLCATAYLHSVMVQERRGLLRVWNLSLLMAAFSLTILATFLTRSGVVESLHSFSQSGSVGPALLGFFAAVVAAAVGLIGWRGDRLRLSGGIESPISREGAFLVNNLLFAGFALVVLLGTVFPLVAQALSGQTVGVGRPYYDSMTRPIGLALLFFMAVAPALPWRRATAETVASRLVIPAWTAGATLVACVAAGVRGLAPLVAFTLGSFAGASALRQLWLLVRRSRRAGMPLHRALTGRSAGGMVVHLGIVMIAVALSASFSYSHDVQVRLAPKRPVRALGQTLTYLGSRTVVKPNRTEMVADVAVAGRGVLHPAISQFGTDTEGVGTPSVSPGLTEDVYLSFDGPPQGPSGGVTVGLIVEPLVSWMWLGGAVLALGAALAAFPRPRRARRAVGPGEAQDDAGAASGGGGSAPLAAPEPEAVGVRR